MKKGWPTKRLSDLYQIGSSKRVLKSQWQTEGVPFYRGREVTRLAADGFVDNELFISEKHFAELSKEYGVPKAGDIVITAIGTIGNSHVVRDNDRFYFKALLSKTARPLPGGARAIGLERADPGEIGVEVPIFLSDGCPERSGSSDG